jgi:hypothetical protein
MVISVVVSVVISVVVGLSLDSPTGGGAGSSPPADAEVSSLSAELLESSGGSSADLGAASGFVGASSVSGIEAISVAVDSSVAAEPSAAAGGAWLELSFGA